MALCFFKRTKLYPDDPDHDTVVHVPFQSCRRWDVNSVLVCSLVKIYLHHWWKSPPINFALQVRKVLSNGETNRLGKNYWKWLLESFLYYTEWTIVILINLIKLLYPFLTCVNIQRWNLSWMLMPLVPSRLWIRQQDFFIICYSNRLEKTVWDLAVEERDKDVNSSNKGIIIQIPVN